MAKKGVMNGGTFAGFIHNLFRGLKTEKFTSSFQPET